MISRLGSANPVLEQALKFSPQVNQRIASLQAALFAVSANGLSELLLSDGDPRFESSRYHAIAAEFDEQYFSQPEGSEQSLSEFSKARSTASLAYALAGEPEEALYEAIASLDDPDALIQLVLRRLHESA